MDEQYSRSYAILGLQPGAAWNDIRHTYKALIKQWHPDHFQENGQNRRAAEERTMEITRAYKTLADYYRIHGSTPIYPAPVANPRTEASAPFRRPDASVRSEETSVPPHGRAHVSNIAGNIPWTTIAILIAILLLLYFWFQNDPIEHGLDADTALGPGAQAALAPEAEGNPAPSHPADKFFTVGSKLGEVYAIQGIPSKTENGVWHYGKSRVYFNHGVVARWESNPESPLYANLDIDPVSAGKKFIQHGSTKDEVRALQGSPWRQTEREWTYGASRIFFKDDRVVDWKESPLNPLKVSK